MTKIFKLNLFVLLGLFLIAGCTATQSVEPALVSEVAAEPATVAPEPTAESAFANLTGEERNAALFEAAQNADVDSLQELIALGADIDYVGAAGLTALGTAVIKSDTGLVELFLDSGADANVIDNQGNNLLHHAANTSNAVVMALLLAQTGIDLNLARDQYGSTPLILAAKNNDVAIAELLIDAGADLEVGDDWDDTPLNIAAYRGSLDALKLLVERGAVIDVVNSQGHNALAHSQNQNHAEVEDYLATLLEPALADLSQEEKDDMLLTAVRADDLDAVAQAVAAGADVNINNRGLGYTPLIIATVRNNPDMAAHLIEAGADVNIADKGDNNLLHHAATKNSLEVATLILESDSEIDLEQTREKWGFTPLMVAAFEGHVDMVELLVNHGADMEAGDDWDDTALNGAVWNGKMEVVQKLVELGASLTVVNSEGKTALDHARNQNRSGIEAFLLTVIDE